jgi:hypothetical protein
MTIEPPPDNLPKDASTEFLRNLFHVTYNVRCRSDGIPEIHQTRDTGAFNDLRGPIEKLGFDWESEMMLYEHRGKKFPDPLRDDPAEFVLIEKNDCLALTTRPPISDHKKEIAGRSKTIASRSYLEGAIFDAVRPYLSVCSRKMIRLNPEFVHQHLSTTERKSPLFTEMTFGQHNDARIATAKSTNKHWKFDFGSSGYTTMGFFLNLPSMPEIGCQLFTAWAQGGKETAAWCRILRKRFPDWFSQPRFAIVEISFDYVPYYPLTLHYADNATVHVHLDHVIEVDDPQDARKTA